MRLLQIRTQVRRERDDFSSNSSSRSISFISSMIFSENRCQLFRNSPCRAPAPIHVRSASRRRLWGRMAAAPAHRSRPRPCCASACGTGHCTLEGVWSFECRWRDTSSLWAEHSSSCCWLPARGCRRCRIVEQVETRRAKIRIHTEMKLPERVVFDTSMPAVTHPRGALAAVETAAPSPLSADDLSAKARQAFAHLQSSDDEQGEGGRY